ncbi:hypothetical protein TNCV_1831571 [Trichonephila clavipes]|nr:hypothetical protein TNCV_1831571 [Trichonephila clavipes]
MKERPVSEITPPQWEAGGREPPNEDETRVRHEGENGRAQEGGLTVPKRVRGAPRTQWEGKCCCFFFAAGMKKKRVCKGNLQTTQQVYEAGASFNTDPSSDERPMHLNVVKCSN